jgi:hypothetical protein
MKRNDKKNVKLFSQKRCIKRQGLLRILYENYSSHELSGKINVKPNTSKRIMSFISPRSKEKKVVRSYRNRGTRTEYRNIFVGHVTAISNRTVS